MKRLKKRPAHYCVHCGLDMPDPQQNRLCRDRDGDLCEPKKRGRPLAGKAGQAVKGSQLAGAAGHALEQALKETELSQLWYLALALVQAPAQHQGIFQAIRKIRGRLPPRSPAMKTALGALEKAFKRQSKSFEMLRPVDLDRLASTKRQSSRIMVELIADALFKQKDPVKEAGRALHWALEHTGGRSG